ncbi:phytanoyl-CoA dioxygenase family protein [Novosphingobium sp. Gsoil 351]|uniref:phytanoyl-CoA dioxygenase family protein n=1 Tax=Novosphingobium sp. Gsoil 351 TaxID=2675225 RepID=UPI0012B4C162|nr:phytanoyl-CoA dioxygenase family protein [Novosphingobium sp. Gsoil 351]QGN54092.1 phytanoyl-CoA dioxygenase family protein [Novosphingobium sp. Gsoil 351]
MTQPACDQATIDRWAADLFGDGYCVIPDLVPARDIARLDEDLAPDFCFTPFCQGKFYGEKTKRFGRVLARTDHATPLVMHPLVLGVVKRVLDPWCDTIQLNLTQGISIYPGALAQMPHRDQDMWGGPKGKVEYLVNVMWPISRFTRENGATRIWRNSHMARINDNFCEGDEVVPEMAPGSALLFLGSTLHAAGANCSSETRRALVTGYSLGWLKAYENQILAYPPMIARTFDPELAALVGYRQHRPNLGNFDGQCPSVLLGPIPTEPLAAIDALRPDQVAAVDAHAAAQPPTVPVA